MPANLTFRMKLAESSSACSLVNHLNQREMSASAEDMKLGRAYLSASVEKFRTPIDSPESPSHYYISALQIKAPKPEGEHRVLRNIGGPRTVVSVLEYDTDAPCSACEDVRNSRI